MKHASTYISNHSLECGREKYTEREGRDGEIHVRSSRRREVVGGEERNNEKERGNRERERERKKERERGSWVVLKRKIKRKSLGIRMLIM